MTEKIYYVIQNKEGKFFKIDNWTGGYPDFVNNFEVCEKYDHEELANNFLKSRYVTEMFTKEFMGEKVRKVEMKLV